MARMGSAFVTGLTVALSGVVHAQSTVGEVLDGGGSQLSREDVLGLLSGASVSGLSDSGNETQAEIKVDGAITGSLRNPAGHTGSYFGKWNVDDQGRFCRDIKINYRKSSSTDSSCAFYFKLGAQYFIADTADRTAVLLSRTVTRK